MACRGYEVVEEGLAVLEVAGQQGQEDLFLQLQWVDPSRPILWRREVIEHFFSFLITNVGILLTFRQGGRHCKCAAVSMDSTYNPSL